MSGLTTRCLCHKAKWKTSFTVCFQTDSHSLYLEQELESLKVVLDIKNKQLHQQDKKLMQMDKVVRIFTHTELHSCSFKPHHTFVIKTIFLTFFFYLSWRRMWNLMSLCKKFSRRTRTSKPGWTSIWLCLGKAACLASIPPPRNIYHMTSALPHYAKHLNVCIINKVSSFNQTLFVQRISYKEVT